MRKDLAKQYDPKNVEDRIYKFWLDGKYFHAKCEPDKKPYTIVIPPPNITGQLHMGHALDNTLQDILIRWRRMEGYDTLWLPGTDHASIATEAKIVEAMKEEGITTSKVHARNDTHSMFADSRDDNLPGVESFNRTHLCIPVGWWVTKEDRERIADLIIKFAK